MLHVIADSDAQPVVFHCAAGKDRTGLTSALVLGLCGVADELIVADFAFYGMIPFAFALRDGENAVPAAFLLLSFYVNGASFLAFAILAEKRGLQTRARGEKSLYFTAGIMEGGETILCMTAMCLWPTLFGPLAWVFGALCLATATARILLAQQVFGD